MFDSYRPWNSPGQNTGVGSLSLLQGISPTQGWSPGLLCCSWILNQLNHKGSPIYNIFTHFLSPKSSFFFPSDFKIQTFAWVPKSINTLAPGTTVTGPNGYVSLCRTCLVTFLGGLGWSGDTVYHAMGTAVKQPWMVHFWIKVWSYLSFWSLVSLWSRWSKNHFTTLWHGCLHAGVTRNQKPFIACSLLNIIFISTSILKIVKHFKNNKRLIFFKKWHFFSHDAIYFSHIFSSMFGPGQDSLERLCI